MPPFFALPLALGLIVLNPCFVTCHDAFEDASVFFVALKKLVCNIHALLVFRCKLFWNFIVVHNGTCRSIGLADVRDCCNLSLSDSSVFLDLVIHLLDDLFCTDCA